MRARVSEEEILWVVTGQEPTTAPVVADWLPIAYQSTLYRLSILQTKGLLHREDDQEPHTWTLTDAGRERVADADFPAPTETAVAEYFDDRDYGPRPEDVSGMILDALRRTDGDWLTTTDFVEEIPVSRDTVLRHLDSLVEEELVSVDDSYRPYRWRLVHSAESRPLTAARARSLAADLGE